MQNNGHGGHILNSRQTFACYFKNNTFMLQKPNL